MRQSHEFMFVLPDGKQEGNFFYASAGQNSYDSQTKMNNFTRLGLLWAVIGLAAVLVSLPVVWALSRAAGLGAPPVGGVLLLGAGVVLAFAGGGLLGAALGSVGGRNQGGIRALGGAFAGLLWGGALCAVVAPIYAQSALDGLTRAGAALVYEQRDMVLGERRLPEAPEAVEAAKRLARGGAARLPALALLGWTLCGPALAGAVEARRHAARRW